MAMAMANQQPGHGAADVGHTLNILMRQFNVDFSEFLRHAGDAEERIALQRGLEENARTIVLLHQPVTGLYTNTKIRDAIILSLANPYMNIYYLQMAWATLYHYCVSLCCQPNPEYNYWQVSSLYINS